jgi:hypothetical protein
MSYRPSTERYAGGGKVKYIVYRSPQPLRNGRVQQRTRVKRLYFPIERQEHLAWQAYNAREANW